MAIVAFTTEQAARAKVFLATKVAEMMGRKFEEEDWAQVYCAAKDIPLAAWSNLDIDIMHGPLGVEQKMMCWDGKSSILDLAGTTRMHPAGTRAVRFPRELDDPTTAARDVLRQYGELIDRRTSIVRTVNAYVRNDISRNDALTALRDMGMSRKKAVQTLPDEVAARIEGLSAQPIDMRMGWLIWQRHLEEFLYFEEVMVKPEPNRFRAEWSERAAGRRRESRNLWVYEIDTGVKVFSITNEAGTKIQPYFSIPPLGDPTLFHFRVQGEYASPSTVRAWVTPATRQQLQVVLGATDPATLAAAIERINFPERSSDAGGVIFSDPAEELIVPQAAYERLVKNTVAVSDEHRFRILANVLEA